MPEAAAAAADDDEEEDIYVDVLDDTEDHKSKCAREGHGEGSEGATGTQGETSERLWILTAVLHRAPLCVCVCSQQPRHARLLSFASEEGPRVSPHLGVRGWTRVPGDIQQLVSTGIR